MELYIKERKVVAICPFDKGSRCSTNCPMLQHPDDDGIYTSDFEPHEFVCSLGGLYKDTGPVFNQYTILVDKDHLDED